MKKLCLFLTLAGLVIMTTACSSMPAVSAAAKSPCDLSALKIKDVKIENDTDGFVSRAIRSNVYKFGAKAAKDGRDVIGTAKINGFKAAIMVSVEVPQMAFASVADTRDWGIDTAVMHPAAAANILGEKVAHDFCEASQFAPTTVPKK